MGDCRPVVAAQAKLCCHPIISRQRSATSSSCFMIANLLDDDREAEARKQQQQLRQETQVIDLSLKRSASKTAQVSSPLSVGDKQADSKTKQSKKQRKLTRRTKGGEQSNEQPTAGAAASQWGPMAQLEATVGQRRSRTMFADWQLAGLEWRFLRNKYLTTNDRIKMANLLQLNQLQVKTWFQNRRMKWKKQILASGGTKSPTKPKGRPRRDSIPPIDD